MNANIEKIGPNRYKVKVGYNSKWLELDTESMQEFMLEMVTAKGYVEFHYDDTRFDGE